MEHGNNKWEEGPQRIEWQEEVEYYPIYIDKQTYLKLRKMKKHYIADFCINKIVDKLDNPVFSVDRNELLEQIDDMFEAMGDKLSPCNSYLILVRLNHIVEGR
ncbi:hypothetical protein EF808_02740 [archaeon]|jgi:hypothetical protein|nr:MAG: hypothetical protein EF808_02740 [archaeon]